jgi:hypothetical protein
MAWPENTAFSPTLPTLQLYWDSTSLGALKRCPRYYQLANVEGWTRKGEGGRVDLDFGIWLHAGRERYYHARASGSTHETGVDAALQYVLTVTYDPVTGRPWQGDSYKNRFTLARTLLDYLDKWEHDPLVTVILDNKKPAVEMTFKFPLGQFARHDTEYRTVEPEEFFLCGHLDRVVEFQGKTYISDLKSTRHDLGDRYWKQFLLSNQFNIYTIAGNVVLKSKVAGLIVDACQVLVTEPARFGRRIIEKTEAQLDEFMRSLRVLLDQAQSYAKANFWPQNEQACFQYGRPCEFLEICARAPSVRTQWLKADFTTRVWNPLIERGDV